MDILDELKQDLRRQKFEDVVINNGGKIISFVIAVVLLVTVVYYLNLQKSEANIKAGTELYLLTNSSKKTDEKVAALEEFSKTAPANYSVVAQLRVADELVLASKNDEAKAALQEVAKNPKAEQSFKEIAELKLVNILISENGEEGEILKRLDALSQNNSVFKYSAIEAKANYLLSKGKNEEAAALYNKLLEDKATPESIADRAKQFNPKS
jgi:hypothetical protein